MAKELVSDALWVVVEPLLPPHLSQPGKRGRPPLPDRAALTGILFVKKLICTAIHNCLSTDGYGVYKDFFGAWRHGNLRQITSIDQAKREAGEPVWRKASTTSGATACRAWCAEPRASNPPLCLIWSDGCFWSSTSTTKPVNENSHQLDKGQYRCRRDTCFLDAHDEGQLKVIAN